MSMKPRRTEAGPPFWKAPPDPMKRPAPMAPPLRISISIWTRFTGVALGERDNSHCDHLHVPALEAAMQRVLAICQTLTVGGVWRSIVVLLLTERGAGLCFHVCCVRCRGREGWGMQGVVGDGDRGRPSLMKRDLACHASPCTRDKRCWLAPRKPWGM